MKTIAESIETIVRHHFPNPPASSIAIEAFELLNGWKLDEDMRMFYLSCNGCSLFDPIWTTYRILALDEIAPAKEVPENQIRRNSRLKSWYMICDNRDGDFNVIDTSTLLRGRYPVYDMFHETFPDNPAQIATSFGEFLDRAINSGNHSYWLSE